MLFLTVILAHFSLNLFIITDYSIVVKTLDNNNNT